MKMNVNASSPWTTTSTVPTTVSAPEKQESGLAKTADIMLGHAMSDWTEMAIRAQMRADIVKYFSEGLKMGNIDADLGEQAEEFKTAIYQKVSAIMKARATPDLDEVMVNSLKELKNHPYVISQVGGSVATPNVAAASVAADDLSAKISAILADTTLTQAEKNRKIFEITSAEISASEVAKDGSITDTVKLTETKPETDAEKLAKMIEENKKVVAELNDVKGQMKKYGPGLIRLSLAMHPTEIPTYLRQKYRNRGVGKMSGDIYAQLYHLSDGSFRRFTKQKTRVKNAPALCDALIAKNEKIANDSSLIPAKTIIAERRLIVLKQIKEIIAHMKAVDAKNILAGK